jgi:hypothetical protein
VNVCKKVNFHSQLVRKEAFNWSVESSKHVLIFVYNGADNVKVEKAFKKLCKASGIRGTTVYLSSDVVAQWDVTLQLETEKTAKIKLETAKIKLESAKIEAEERAKIAEAENVILMRKIVSLESGLTVQESRVKKTRHH